MNPSGKSTVPPDVPVQLLRGDVALSGRPVLREVDLTVKRGEFVALMGANGSGKSTLVRTLVGLNPLSAGRLELFGRALGSFHDWSRVGYVPQRSTATGGVPASVWEVVASGRLTHRKLLRCLRKEDRAAIRTALEVVGMDAYAHRGVAQLSGGQHQRVLIARALAGRPELLLLDEPTAGVDLPNQHALAEALGRLKDDGATIVLVAHELGPLAPLVDRAVVMRDGRKAYDGRPLSDADVHAQGFDAGHVHCDDASPEPNAAVPTPWKGL